MATNLEVIHTQLCQQLELVIEFQARSTHGGSSGPPLAHREIRCPPGVLDLRVSLDAPKIFPRAPLDELDLVLSCELLLLEVLLCPAIAGPIRLLQVRCFGNMR